MRSLRYWSHDSLFLWALAIGLMFAGVRCYSQSMSCSMVDGRTICESTKSDGNTAAAFSRASHGQNGAIQDAAAMTGNSFSGIYATPNVGFGTAALDGAKRTFPPRGYGVPNIHPNNNDRWNMNANGVSNTDVRQVTMTGTSTGIAGPNNNPGINTDIFAGTSNIHGIPGLPNSGGIFPHGGFGVPNFRLNNNGRWNLNGNGLGNADVSAVRETVTSTRISGPNGSPGINIDGFAGTSNIHGIPAHNDGTFPLGGDGVSNIHPNNNGRRNFNANGLGNADFNAVRKIDTRTRIAGPNGSPGINTDGFSGTSNIHGPAHRDGTFPFGGDGVSNMHTNNNGRWNLNTDGLNNAEVRAIRKTVTSTTITGPNSIPRINADAFASTSNIHVISGSAHSVGSFPLGGEGAPNILPNNNGAWNLNPNGLGNADVRKTDTSTRISGHNGSPGINADGFASTSNIHVISGSAHNGGAVPLSGDGVRNIHPNNNGRLNLNANGMGNADVSAVRKTVTSTTIAGPNGSPGIKTDGLAGTSNIHGIPGSSHSGGAVPLSGDGVRNIHPNNNGRLNLNANGLGNADVSAVRKTVTSTTIASLNGSPGIITDGLAGISNIHGIPGSSHSDRTFPLGRDGVLNVNPNNNGRLNFNVNSLTNADVSAVRKTVTSTRITGPNGSPGIKTDVPAGTSNIHGILEPTHRDGAVPLRGDGVRNIHPSNNGRWNLNANGLGNADVITVRKTDTSTRIGGPNGSPGIKTDGFAVSSNIHGYPVPAYRHGPHPFGGHGALNIHPNNNGGWNINTDDLAVPGVTDVRSGANTRIFVPNGIGTNGFGNGHEIPAPAYGGFAVANLGNMNGNNPFAVVDDVFRNAGLGPAFPWNGFGKKR